MCARCNVPTWSRATIGSTLSSPFAKRSPTPFLSPASRSAAHHPSSPRQRKARRKKGDDARLQPPLRVLRSASRSGNRHARSRAARLPWRNTRPRQPRDGMRPLQSSQRRSASRGVLCAIPLGRSQLHALCTSGASCIEERGATGGKLGSGSLRSTTENHYN